MNIGTLKSWTENGVKKAKVKKIFDSKIVARFEPIEWFVASFWLKMKKSCLGNESHVFLIKRKLS